MVRLSHWLTLFLPHHAAFISADSGSLVALIWITLWCTDGRNTDMPHLLPSLQRWFSDFWRSSCQNFPVHFSSSWTFSHKAEMDERNRNRLSLLRCKTKTCHHVITLACLTALWLCHCHIYAVKHKTLVLFIWVFKKYLLNNGIGEPSDWSQMYFSAWRWLQRYSCGFKSDTKYLIWFFFFLFILRWIKWRDR